jgi:hypothetical protein
VTALSAAVTWRYVENGANGPTIEANLQVPERHLKVKVTVHKNADKSLPASHLIEIQIDASSDFPGKGIKKVPRFVMKPTDEARGQPLVGAAAKITDGFFWIALSASEADISANLALLRDRDWIDLPFIYETGQRGILTFEKGSQGDQVFRKAMAAWSADTVAATGQVAPTVGKPQVAADSQPSGVKSDRLTMTAAGGRRVALVIGNSAYRSVGELTNPLRDAESIGAALRGDGFAVTELKNVTRAQFVDALNTFSDQAASADWAMIYFAGHGLQLNGVNYLVPVDAKLRVDRDVQDEALQLERLIAAVGGARKFGLVVVDACRDNPFLPVMRFTTASRAARTRGLARVVPQDAILVEFSALEGQLALDGDESGNSPFAHALAQRLATPGLEVGKLLRLIREDVLAATDRQQEPMFMGNMPGEDLFFRVPGAKDADRLVNDNVPSAANKVQAATPVGATGGAEIRMIMPSMDAAVASEVDESQAPTLVGATVASGILNAPWAPWGVQVAGDFSLDRALASFIAIEREFPEFLTGPPLIVRKLNRSRNWAPLYQILIPAADQRAANDICRRLESTDGACMVFKN